jgi:hypothetical protein
MKGRPKSFARIRKNGEPWRARTSDPLIKSAFTDTPAGYGSYDLLISVTACSCQRVYLLPPFVSRLSVFLSQVRLNSLPLHGQRILSPSGAILPHLTKRDVWGFRRCALRIFTQARAATAMSVLDAPRTMLRDVEGTKVALCVRAQTTKPKRESIDGIANTGQS